MTTDRSPVGDLVGSSAWMLFRILALAVWLATATTLMTAGEFGWLATTLSVVAVCALLASGGVPYLFFTDAHAQDAGTLQARWRESLGSISIVGPMLSMLAASAVSWLFHSPVPYIALFGLILVDVMATSTVQSAGLLLHSTGQVAAATALPAVMLAGRAAAGALVFAVGPESGLKYYLWAHASASLLSFVVCLIWAQKSGYSVPLNPKIPTRHTVGQAKSYLLMSGSALVGSELDKPLVGRVAGIISAGHYAAAYRICAAGAVPAAALAAVLLPRWTKYAVGRESAAFRNSFLLAALSAFAAGLLVATLLMWLARAGPAWLDLYPEAWELLVVFAWLPLILGLRQLAATALIAIARPKARVACEMAGLGALVLFMLYGFVHAGLAGIAVACLMAEVLVTLAMATVLYRSTAEGAGE